MSEYECVDSVETLAKTLERVKNAQKEFSKYSQEQVDKIFQAAAIAANEARIPLAKMAVEETGMGIVEDKVIKNHYAAEYIYNKYKNEKTCGVIYQDDSYGIKKIAEPVGIVAAVIPTTNPTSTAIFKTLIALKTRNGIIISPHPRAKKSTIEAAKTVLEAAVKAGAPEDIIAWIDVPSLELTNMLMQSVDIILATGGPGMVKSAYSSGKPALGVGAGNTPAVIDESANVILAVNSIIHSKTFDNGMICASEQSVLVDEAIYKEFEDLMKNAGCYFVSPEEKEKLKEVMFNKEKGYALQSKIPGQSPYNIAKQAGFEVPENTKVLVVYEEGIGPEFPFSKEKLSPVLAYYIVKDSKEGIEKAEKLLENGGLGHSAVIHSEDENIIKEYGKRVKASRIIVNQPSSQGGIGDIYNSFTPSLTLGCGTFGGNSTTDNVSALNLVNIKKMGRRRVNMQWFKVPKKIYFEAGSIKYLEDMRDITRAFIVTDESMVKFGYVDKVLYHLRKRQDYVHSEIFSDVEPDPSFDTVKRGVEAMQRFNPDVIIALGGGSAIDAAKGMWLLYEDPEADLEGLKLKFMDIRKRTYEFPELGKKCQMVAIPTTSGTGSEVTSFAVITDKQKGRKYPLTAYELTPNVAIVDPDFVATLPKTLTADTGMDVLTHALEAYVSNMANDYSDALAEKATRLVFENLKEAYNHGDNKFARERMHNASTMAGMAFTNAFLGICHSMAHKLGAKFHLPHGRINAILLPYVVEYNGSKPTKFTSFPKYEYFIADEKYAQIARMVGLKADTVEEGVHSLAEAIRKLNKDLNIPASFKEAGVDEKEFLDNVDELADRAFEDQCTPANPRLPLVTEIKKILLDSYYGK